jgi:hypothetical protein
MRARIIAVVAALNLVAAAVVIPVAAGASDNYSPPPQIPQHAQCGSKAASGAFGAFGKGNNFAGGANGKATGDNNSDVCGSASNQGNP